MFIEFFYLLRARGVPVATHELLDLLAALRAGLDQQSLQRFYTLWRALCVKRVEHYDLWDQAFYEFFADRPLCEPIGAMTEEVLRWLGAPRGAQGLDRGGASGARDAPR